QSPSLHDALPIKKKTASRPKPPRDDYEFNSRKVEKQKKVDGILDKISRSGYESLSKDEKDFLFKSGRNGYRSSVVGLRSGFLHSPLALFGNYLQHIPCA